MLPASPTGSPRLPRKPRLLSILPPRPNPRSRCRRQSSARRLPRSRHQDQHGRRRPNGASRRDGYPRMEALMLPAGRSAAWFISDGDRARVLMDTRTTPLSTRAEALPHGVGIMRVRGCTTGPIIRPSMPGREQLILTGCRAAAPILATMSDTCFFISTGLSGGSSSTRRMRRNEPASLPRFTGCLKPTAIITRTAYAHGSGSINML